MDNMSNSQYYFFFHGNKQGSINSLNVEECNLELSPWGLSKSQPPGFLRFVKRGLLL